MAARETDRASSLHDPDGRRLVAGATTLEPGARALARPCCPGSGTPAVGIPRARSHPALANSIIGRVHIVASKYRQQQRIAAAAGLFSRDSCCKKEERLAPLHFLAPWYTPSNPQLREEHCSTLRTNR